LELAPQRVGMHAHLAVNLVAQERGAEALAEALREQEEWARLWAVAIIQHAAYRRDESNAALGELIAKYAAASAYQVAEVYGARGEVDLAFAWLERACAQRDAGLAGMKQARTLRALHSDPRWETFLRMIYDRFCPTADVFRAEVNGRCRCPRPRPTYPLAGGHRPGSRSSRDVKGRTKSPCG